MTHVKVLNYDEPMDLLLTAVEAFGSETEIRKLKDRTQGGKKTKFRNRNWVHPKAPFGYIKDDGWLAIDEEKAGVVKAIFAEFICTENYSETARRINSRFGDVLGEKIKRYKVKNIVTNSVYEGRPSYGDDVEVDDPSLAIVDRETFAKTQEIVEKIHEIYAKGKDEYIDEKIGKYGFGHLSKETDIAAICKLCGSIMKKSGSKTVRGVMVGQYKCPDCGHESTVPLGAQLAKFEGRKLISCPYCRVTENFAVTRQLSGKYIYRCKSCDGEFVTEADPDIYLRNYPPEEDEGDDEDEE